MQGLSIAIQSNKSPAVLDRAMEPDYGNTQMVLSLNLLRGRILQVCVFSAIYVQFVRFVAIEPTGQVLIPSTEGFFLSSLWSWIFGLFARTPSCDLGSLIGEWRTYLQHLRCKVESALSETGIRPQHSDEPFSGRSNSIYLRI